MEDDNSGTDGNADGYHLVSGAGLIEVFGQRPGGGVSVVGLNGGTTPGRVSVGICEEVAIAADDGDHDGVVDKTTQDGPVDLSSEHDTGWDLKVFAELQIVTEVDAVCDDIVGPGSEVHIANGAPGEHKTCQHLGQVVGGNTVSVTGV